MSTNYYAIPKEEIVKERKKELIRHIKEMELTPANIKRRFAFIPRGDWEHQSPWEYFMEGMVIHLGKRSSGWKFSWNFHADKYYKNKKELLEFIRAGRVVDEYGDEMDVEEFIEMALNWGEPDGKYVCKEYFEEQRKLYPTGTFMDHPDYYDREVDGLRVSSSTEFS